MRNTEFVPFIDDYSGETHYKFRAKLISYVPQRDEDGNPTEYLPNSNGTLFKGVTLSFYDPDNILHEDVYGILYKGAVDWSIREERPIKLGKVYNCVAMATNKGTTLIKMAPFGINENPDISLFSGEVESTETVEVVESITAEELVDEEF